MRRILQSKPPKDEKEALGLQVLAHGHLTAWHSINGRYRSALPHHEALMRLPGIPKDTPRGTLVRAFAHFPDQTVAAFRPSTIHFEPKGPQIWAPATVNGVSATFLLDSGAGISAVRESTAKRLGLKIIDVEPADAMDFAHKSVAVTTVALAERLDMGGISLRNVPFLVFSDRILPVDVLGITVLLACRQIRWTPGGTLQLGHKPTGPRKIREANLAFDETSLLLAARFGAKELQFFLDTAAGDGHLYQRFADVFPDHVKNAGTQQPFSFGGIGGSRDFPSITILPELTLRLGPAQITLRPAPVVPLPDQIYHGLLGMGIFRQAHAVTLDFQTMVVRIE